MIDPTSVVVGIACGLPIGAAVGLLSYRRAALRVMRVGVQALVSAVGADVARDELGPVAPPRLRAALDRLAVARPPVYPGGADPDHGG